MNAIEVQKAVSVEVDWTAADLCGLKIMNQHWHHNSQFTLPMLGRAKGEVASNSLQSSPHRAGAAGAIESIETCCRGMLSVLLTHVRQNLCMPMYRMVPFSPSSSINSLLCNAVTQPTHHQLPALLQSALDPGNAPC